MEGKQTVTQNGSRATLEDGVIMTESNGELLIVDERREQVYGLEGPAADALVLFHEGRTWGEVTDALLAQYDVQRAVLQADLESILLELAQRGVIRILAPSGM